MTIEDRRPELSLADIEYLKGKGYSQSAIARMYGVSRQAISWWIHTYGGKMTPRQIVLKAWPWKVPAEMSQAAPYRNMRNHGEYIATGGKGMSADKLNRLRSFYRMLREEDLVVEFDPAIPPTPGVSNKGGWAFRQRLPEDGDLLIRVNEHTNLTEDGRRIWRFPEVEPPQQ